jgi:hypothetical protein
MPYPPKPLRPLLASIDDMLHALEGKQLASDLGNVVVELQRKLDEYTKCCHEGHVIKKEEDTATKGTS